MKWPRVPSLDWLDRLAAHYTRWWTAFYLAAALLNAAIAIFRPSVVTPLSWIAVGACLTLAWFQPYMRRIRNDLADIRQLADRHNALTAGQMPDGMRAMIHHFVNEMQRSGELPSGPVEVHVMGHGQVEMVDSHDEPATPPKKDLH